MIYPCYYQNMIQILYLTFNKSIIIKYDYFKYNSLKIKCIFSSINVLLNKLNIKYM